MTVQRALAKWMENNGFGVFNADLFIGTIPLERKINAGWWIIGGGGAPILKPETGEKMKQYVFAVFYRDTDPEQVDQKLQALEEMANSNTCHSLEDYDTVELEATGFQSDNDMDSEDRTLASVEITVTVYQH